MAYESNVLLELKREALGNRNIELLRNIKLFESSANRHISYYMREEEMIIRDAMGNVIDPDDLTPPKYGPHLDFADINIGRAVGNERTQPVPGMLHNYIGRIANGEEPYYSSTIHEVIESTSFPLPADYDWYLSCEADPVTEPDKTAVFKISGREKVTIYVYWNQFGHKVLSTQKPCEWELFKK